mmetsp:Transcript_63374/g.117870  ORF Transcript_63374/g.117870 Transcript_63374/m.117870 type:complete len:210 (+) Transcript_63374:256-885(+)
MYSGTRRRLLPEGEYCDACSTESCRLAYSPKVREGRCPRCQRTNMPIEENACCSYFHCCGIKWLRYDPRLQQQQAVLYCAHCTAGGMGRQALQHNRACGHCHAFTSPVCPSCSRCGSCSLCSLGYELDGLPVRPRDATKFLITRSLYCIVATPESTINLLQSYPEVQLAGVTKQVVDVTVDHIRLMVLRGFCGSTNVLTDTFPFHTPGA